MKKFTLQILTLLLLTVGILSGTAANCQQKIISTNVHHIDARLVGKWMWTKASDGAYYKDNGVYSGSAYGFAIQYTINADGSGTCFNHVSSSLGVGNLLEVNIYYNGFFESDDQGHMGFFPTSGTYKSSSGTNRPLRADELWNTTTNTGRNFLSKQLQFTTQGNRSCFKTTSDDGKTDTFFKQN